MCGSMMCLCSLCGGVCTVLYCTCIRFLQQCNLELTYSFDFTLNKLSVISFYTYQEQEVMIADTPSQRWLIVIVHMLSQSQWLHTNFISQLIQSNNSFAHKPSTHTHTSHIHTPTPHTPANTPHSSHLTHTQSQYSSAGPAPQFFEECDIYWAPSSVPNELYEQLAKQKYREILRPQIQ